MSYIAQILIEYNVNVPDNFEVVDKWYQVNCLFHDDSNASAAFNPEREAYNCLAGCPSGGPIQLIMNPEEVTFTVAKQRFEEISGEPYSALLETTGKQSNSPGVSKGRARTKRRINSTFQVGICR